MDGATILLIGIYFFPSGIALGRSHRNLPAIFLTNLLTGWTVIGWIIALVWASTNGPKVAADQSEPPDATSQDADHNPQATDKTREALKVIRSCLEQCKREHADAIRIMAVVAQADGRISRNDLKIMFDFCSRQGTSLPDELADAIPLFNAGVTMNIQGDGIYDAALFGIESRPMLYLTGLHGVLTAMTIGAKRKNKTSTELMSRLEDLIQRRAGQADPEPSKASELSITITDNLSEPARPTLAAPSPIPETRSKPPQFKPQSWVEQAKREIAAERQR